jgi:hypothetical protein
MKVGHVPRAGRLALLAAALLVSLGVAEVAAAHSSNLEIEVLSNRGDLISGGDALVEVDFPAWVSPSRVSVDVDGRDVTSAFAVRGDGRYTGLVTGLEVGKNVLTARIRFGPRERITITNHPIGGPVFSGPQLLPYVCRTQQFGLAPATDIQCNAPTVVSHRYRSAVTGTFLVYDPASPPPAAEIATTTTDEGIAVPYIVRVERGTMNRGIYELAVLTNPATSWAPWASQLGWNNKVLWLFGGGSAPWRTQAGPSSALVDMALSRGFMVANSSLNIRGQNGNDWISAESVMMLQERIREGYGSIRYTIGSGCSGGSIQQHLIAANYPGLLNGILPNCSYEDSWTTAMEVGDCHLLFNYFNRSPTLWASAAQRAAVSGHRDTSACIAWEFSFAPIGNPARVQNCNLQGLPEAALVYNPVTNPGGIRCTLQDHQVAIWGRNAQGFARRPTDNVGVQYGLKALEAGQISVEQFVDLNEKIGGVDPDFAFTAQRSTADPGAMTIAYWAGQVSNPYSLANVPMIDLRGSSNINDIHTDFHSHSMRARLDEANGGHGNQLIWTWPSGIVPPAAINQKAFLLMDRWVAAIEADDSGRPQRFKVLRNKPTDAIDLCWSSTNPLVEISDPAQCAALLPFFADPRLVAGMPLSHDILKCDLRQLRRSDYDVTFTDEQWARLQSAFPTGVCDWRHRGVGQWLQRIARPWLTFEHGPGGIPLGSAPRSKGH